MPKQVRWLALPAATMFVLVGCASQVPRSVSTGPSPAAVATSAAVVETSAPMPEQPPGIRSMPAAGSGRPSVAEAKAALKAMVYANSNHVVVASVSDLKIARDSKGRWWVSGWAEPVPAAQTDTALVFMYKDGRRWVLFDLGSGIDQSELPKDVRGKL